MRSEERVKELHRKMAVLEKKKAQKVIAIQTAVTFAASLFLAITSAVMIARLPKTTAAGVPGSMAGSIFAENGALGYIMVALISLCLGISFTLFCVFIRKRMKEE